MRPLPLAYSSNLHPAETCAEIAQALRVFAGPLRRELGWDRLGVDLRLGSLALSGDLGLIRAALDAERLSAHTLNGFPLRPFQAERVKEDAYLPDWSEAARLADSLRLIDAALLLSDEPEVTVSTCPGSFRPLGAGRNDPRVFAAALGHWAAAAHRVRVSTGRSVVLCPEPEPWCQLETSWDVAAFWSGALAEDGLRAAQSALDGDAAAARLALDRQLGVCFDTCHLSLAFEDQAAAAQRMRAAGARIVKVQVSAAPQADLTRAGQAEALAAMAEPRFLHQSAAQDDTGSLVRCVDLPDLPAMLARLPQARLARSHFHVPIDATALANGLATTAADSRAGLAAAAAVGQPHLAVETYTWPLLAADETARRAGTARELATLAAWRQ
ncbi:MAG TPA: sugar phosphate isomerase [Planctomycetes bacterium]|nr:sugar phosphate isomerase [Planctomycetota bacterium]